MASCLPLGCAGWILTTASRMAPPPPWLLTLWTGWAAMPRSAPAGPESTSWGLAPCPLGGAGMTPSAWKCTIPAGILPSPATPSAARMASPIPCWRSPPSWRRSTRSISPPKSNGRRPWRGQSSGEPPARQMMPSSKRCSPGRAGTSWNGCMGAAGRGGTAPNPAPTRPFATPWPFMPTGTAPPWTGCSGPPA